MVSVIVWLCVYDVIGQTQPPLCVTFLQCDVHQKSPPNTHWSFFWHTLPPPLSHKHCPILTLLSPVNHSTPRAFCSNKPPDTGMFILSQNSTVGSEQRHSATFLAAVRFNGQARHFLHLTDIRTRHGPRASPASSVISHCCVSQSNSHHGENVQLWSVPLRWWTVHCFILDLWRGQRLRGHERRRRAAQLRSVKLLQKTFQHITFAPKRTSFFNVAFSSVSSWTRS